jgi:hypothetical protein
MEKRHDIQVNFNAATWSGDRSNQKSTVERSALRDDRTGRPADLFQPRVQRPPATAAEAFGAGGGEAVSQG